MPILILRGAGLNSLSVQGSLACSQTPPSHIATAFVVIMRMALALRLLQHRFRCHLGFPGQVCDRHQNMLFLVDHFERFDVLRVRHKRP